MWICAGYAFAAVVARAFANSPGQPTCGAWKPIASAAALVRIVPLEPFRTDPAIVWMRCPVEIV